jgi:alkanesulfonate monooxygenase SsuD/methylene tetrahydromethanopterin reductase-like flavin-dependent oxidoreductase (luciferase family)
MSLVGENEHSVNKLVKRYSHEVNRFRPDGVELDDYLKGLIVGTPDECVEKLRQYVKVGVTYFMLYFPDVGEGNSRELFASSVMNQFI